MRLIGDLIRTYGEGVPSIFEVALKDWPAMRRKYGQKLPEVPTVRAVYQHRAELADAAVRGGIKIAEARISRYAKDKGDDVSWERK